MGKLVGLLLALAVVACGGAPLRAAQPTAAPSSAAPAATAAPTQSPVATPYPPKAEGFASKVLVERPRNLGDGFTGFIWIAAAGPELPGVSASVSDTEAFNAFYESAAKRASVKALYTTPDLLPLAPGNYSESLRQVVVQPAGRSSAHKHSGIEAVLVLEGTVLVRSAMGSPTVLAKGQGFHILPNMPVQLINAGTGVARTLVYSISPAGLPFSTELEQAP